MKTSTFLITTNQYFLKPKNPSAKIIFLGKWCNLYTQKDAYKIQDKKSVSYHWNNRTKLKQDYKIIVKHYKYLLKKLTIILNNIHKVNKQERYWNILIGPWLLRLLTIYFDRYIQIKKIIKKNPNLKAISIKSVPYKFTPNDTQEFVDLCIDDPFNENICAEILKELQVNILYKRSSFKTVIKKNSNTENRPFINLLQNISRWIPYII
jgi:putative transferase (TIGR04331 family)